jgi:hypothetical protein
VVASCETDANGAYDLTIGSSFPVRLELSNIPDYLRPGPAGPDSATTVTFVSGATSGRDFGLANPAQYCDPATSSLATTCFVNGSAVNSAGGPNDTLVRWPYSNRGTAPGPIHISERDHIGSAWGLAYNTENEDLYTSAFLKRHVGLRNGLGAIFITDPFAATTNGQLFVDVAAAPFNLDVGEIGTDADRGLVADPTAQNNDPAAFYAVGKVGLADLAISEDNQFLWFLNLFNKTLYSLEIDSDGDPNTPPTPADLQAFPLPITQCNSYQTLYLNAGGPNFANLVSPAWNGDGYYVGGTAGTTTGAPNGAPYTTKRSDPSSFEYIVPMPDGIYNVTLHVYDNTPLTFNATVEGTTQNIAVGAGIEHNELFNGVVVKDGMMNFIFDDATVGDPTINGIQITAASGQPFNETAAFALKILDGDIYVGLICTAEYSQDVTQLDAHVYRLANGTLPFAQVVTFALDYSKGPASSFENCPLSSNWHPWATSIPPSCTLNGERIVWPQPMLSGIEFDVDGSLILTFMDRLGHQLGNFNWVLAGTDIREGVIGGDILRLYNNNGTYELENNGTVGPLAAAWLTADNGVGNGEGPGGGEFYQDDASPPRSHRETPVGGLAHIYGSGEVVATTMDPIGTAESGGVLFFDNVLGSSTTGAADDSFDGYQIYVSSSVATFGKSNGLGDLVLLCAVAPIVIGNRVWFDADADGVQDADAGEDGIDGVTVGLYDANGLLLASMETITDPQGNPGFYQFVGDGLDGATWVTAGNVVQPHTDYTVAIFDSEFTAGEELVGLFMTLDNQNPDGLPTPDIRDSDGVAVSVGTGANAATRGVSLTTGAPGDNDHTFDFGFTLTPTAVTLQSTIITPAMTGWLYILVIFIALAVITYILLPYRLRTGRE